MHKHSVEITERLANPTAGTELNIDHVWLLLLPTDRLNRTITLANQAARAEFWVDLVGNQAFAHFRRTGFLVDVGLIFVPKEAHGCEHWIGGGLAQSTEGSGFDRLAEFKQIVKIRGLALSLTNPIQGFQDGPGANPAG